MAANQGLYSRLKGANSQSGPVAKQQETHSNQESFLWLLGETLTQTEESMCIQTAGNKKGKQE